MLKKFLKLNLDRRAAVKALVACAMLAALAFVLKAYLGFNVMAGGVKVLSLNFSFIPVMFAGFLFGPLYGGIVGVVADLIGFLANPIGVYNPAFALSFFLIGFAAGTFFYFFPTLPSKIWGAALFCVPVTLLVGGLLNTYWISAFFGASFAVIFPLRFLSEAVCSVVYTFLIFILMRYGYAALKKAKLI